MQKYDQKQQTREGIRQFTLNHPEIQITPINNGSGCGAYSPVYRVETEPFKGRVIKALTKDAPDSIRQLHSLTEEYQRAVITLGIIIPTTQPITEGDNLFYLVQEFVQAPTALSLMIRAEPCQFLNTFRTITEVTLQAYQQMHLVEDDFVLGLDSRLENWAMTQIPTYLDLFPPLLVDKSGKFRRNFYTTDFEKVFADKPTTSFLRHSAKSLLRLFYEACTLQPDLREDLAQILLLHTDSTEQDMVKRAIKMQRQGNVIVNRCFEHGSS